MIIEKNICLLSDSYKFWHWKVYPQKTEYVYSYLEARIGAKYNKSLFYGLQYILKKYLKGQVITEKKIEQAKSIIDAHLGPEVFNEEGWLHILNEHDGHLPIAIKAVPEGSLIPVDNVLMTIVNTDPECYWLTNYIESLLLHIWEPITIATLSYEIKKMLKFYSNITCENNNHLDFQLHDFGYRSAPGTEAAALGGSGHLVNFNKTDTVPALLIPINYYNGEIEGYSCKATEHSIMTSRGPNGEYRVTTDILNQTNGILSLVIDSYDDSNFIRRLLLNTNGLLQNFLNRRSSNKIVFRPDSGDCVSTTLKILDIMREYLYIEENSKGYKMLPHNYGVLFGDGLDYQKIRDILFALKNAGWASSNIVFGMGGGLHTDVNRDTQRFAFKSSAQKRDGEWFDIQKDPLDSSKKSKRGILSLIKTKDDNYKTLSNKSSNNDLLKTVFRNGKIIREYIFEDIKRRVEDE